MPSPRYDRARRTYRVATHFWGYRLSAPELRDLDADGRPAFVSSDDRFVSGLKDDGAGWPIQIWSYRRGHFTDVTRRHPRAIRHDAARLWRLYVKNRGRISVRGILPAWAADQYMLGRGAAARRALARAGRRGDLACLAGCFDGPPDAAAVLRRFDRQLRRTATRASPGDCPL